jgi:uncharacterized membrane protein
MSARIRKTRRSSLRCRKTCDFMDAPERGALMLVRLIAAALIGWTLVDLSLYWIVNQHYNTPMKIFPCVLKSIPAVLGIVALIKSKALAQWISDKLDE